MDFPSGKGYLRRAREQRPATTDTEMLDWLERYATQVNCTGDAFVVVADGFQHVGTTLRKAIQAACVLRRETKGGITTARQNTVLRGDPQERTQGDERPPTAYTHAPNVPFPPQDADQQQNGSASPQKQNKR